MKKEKITSIDVSLDKDIQDKIEKNARQGWLEYNLEREKRLKQEKVKEKILSTIVGLFIIIATCLLLILNSKLTEKATKNCIEAGHSENYCYERL